MNFESSWGHRATLASSVLLVGCAGRSSASEPGGAASFDIDPATQAAYIAELCASEMSTPLVQLCQAQLEQWPGDASAEEKIYHVLGRACIFDPDEELLIQLCNDPVPGQARALRTANGFFGACSFGLKSPFLENLPQAMAQLCADVPELLGRL